MKGRTFSGIMEIVHEIHRLPLPILAEGLVPSRMNNKVLNVFMFATLVSI